MRHRAGGKFFRDQEPRAEVSCKIEVAMLQRIDVQVERAQPQFVNGAP